MYEWTNNWGNPGEFHWDESFWMLDDKEQQQIFRGVLAHRKIGLLSEEDE